MQAKICDFGTSANFISSNYATETLGNFKTFFYNYFIYN